MFVAYAINVHGGRDETNFILKKYPRELGAVSSILASGTIFLGK